MTDLPAWAQEMRQLFRSGSTSQFILHGNVHDLMPRLSASQEPEYVSLRKFLTGVMFDPFDVVIQYDRGRGILVRKGSEPFHNFLKAYDAFRGTKWAGMPDPGPGKSSLSLANLLPRRWLNIALNVAAVP